MPFRSPAALSAPAASPAHPSGVVTGRGATGTGAICARPGSLNHFASVIANVQVTDERVPTAEFNSRYNRMKAEQLERLEVAGAVLKLVRGSGQPGHVRT